MDLVDLRERFKKLIGAFVTSGSTDSGAVSNATIDDFLNEANNEIYMNIARRKDTQDYVAARTTMTYTASTEAVSLPAAAQRRQIIYVKYQATGTSDSFERVQLERRNTTEFDEYAGTGDPEVFCTEGASLMVRPVPSSNTTLYLRYVPALTELSADDDSPDWIPSEYHHILAWSAVALFKARRNDEDAERFSAIAEGKRDEFVKYVIGLVNNSHFASGARN